MITYTQALNIISRNVCNSNRFELVKTENSGNRILLIDYYSKANLPDNNVSSMDGVVVLKNEKRKRFEIIGESKAGDRKAKKINNGECVLIYTGAPVHGDDKRVIPKENVEIQNKHIYVNDFPSINFIRKKCSDLEKNKKYLHKKSIMNVRSIALAKSMKLKRLKVLKKPKIFVICTGDELIKNKNETPLVESTNNIFIKHFVELFGGELIKIELSKDNHNEFLKKYKTQNKFDLLITSGGVSRGRYDIVKSALQDVGLKILFERVAIKPGKPTTFGKFNKDKYFLGLPGNPVSCFTSLINFLPTFINSFYGFKYIDLKQRELSSGKFIKKNSNLTLFQRVIIKNNYFKLIDSQDSSLINMLNIADGILIRKPFSKPIKRKQNAKVLVFNDFINQKFMT